ncbi:adenylate cyclase associated N terminal-domain-containing protein [Podospora fimiseda]|uniref:Adenylyl cyclase-associated protein n=1 Tax=Podospora fimiseda TaxID=252190 RepID=A0AAN7BV05_9PEZI|nr:adenylate cyclase associated N terminal-domain-containing protein [Podospora fimiseda]
MHNFTTLIKRLEAATSRLEDIAQLAIDLNPADDETLAKAFLTPSVSSSTPAPSNTPTPTSAGAPPAAPALKAAAPPPPPPPPPPQEDLPENVQEFDNFINNSIKGWVKLSHEIDAAVGEQADLVLKGHQATRRLLLIASKAKKPDYNGPEWQTLMKSAVEVLSAVEKVKETNRGKPFYDHLAAVADSILVLAWPGITSKPYKHAEEMLGAAQFYGNRVIKTYKETDPKQLEWTRALYQIFRDLTEYIKTYHNGGIIWNAKGQSALDVAKAMDSAPAAHSAPAPPAGGAPPPPPPPGPPPVLKINEVKADPSPASGLGAVFSELNQGEAVTKGLRKVDKSQMTHKNPSLRASSVVPDSGSSVRGKSPAPPGTKPKPQSMRVKKPPKRELDGNKWTLENYDSPSEPVEIEVTMNHSILISKCSNTTVIIKGKGNAITLENTTRVALVVDSLVSTVDVVKSKNFALQVMGTIPTILLDQLDGAQIYLSKESASTKVYTSKSDSVNINVIDGEDGDYKEVPLPSQICSYWDEEKKEMVSEIVTHSG